MYTPKHEPLTTDEAALIDQVLAYAGWDAAVIDQAGLNDQAERGLVAPSLNAPRVIVGHPEGYAVHKVYNGRIGRRLAWFPR